MLYYMILGFPKFENLNFQHKQEIDKITQNFLPYCDYNFVSLWCYDTKNNIEISKLNNNLIIKFTDYLSTKSFYSFFGKNKFEETCLTLLKLSKASKFDLFLKLIPEIFINKNHQYKKIIITEDRDNFDYIYLLKKLCQLEGKKFEKKRRLLHQFIRNHPNHKVNQLDLTQNNIKKQVINLFFLWEKIKKKKRSETNNELIALKKLITHAHKFNLVTTGISINNILVGFTINEIINKNFAIGHFAKSDHNFEGMNEALHKYTADILIEKNCQYINLEQDMGLENLRYAKSLWQPEFFLKKYTIKKK